MKSNQYITQNYETAKGKQKITDRRQRGLDILYCACYSEKTFAHRDQVYG